MSTTPNDLVFNADTIDAYTRLRAACEPSPHESRTCTVRQVDVLRLIDALLAASTGYHEQRRVIARLLRETPTPAVIEPRLCTRQDCAVSK